MRHLPNATCSEWHRHILRTLGLQLHRPWDFLHATHSINSHIRYIRLRSTSSPTCTRQTVLSTVFCQLSMLADHSSRHLLWDLFASLFCCHPSVTFSRPAIMIDNDVSRIFRRTHSPNRLVWSEDWQPPGAQSAFIKWTGWTLAMTMWWWQHHKHCRGYYYYYYPTVYAKTNHLKNLYKLNKLK